VLYDRESGKVTLVDFEHYRACTLAHLRSLDAPELMEIVGDTNL